MKNVKTLLIFITISTFVFASTTRTDALGGAGFWADDYANITNFPASVNNHNVAYTSGNNFATIFDQGSNKWGFSGGNNNIGDEVNNIDLAIKAENRKINYIGREPAASPASGYLKKHLAQQKEIIEKVLS